MIGRITLMEDRTLTPVIILPESSGQPDALPFSVKQRLA
jgi:hypothetical protein